MSDLKRLFIVGCPRSGTTWLALLLGYQPGVSVCTHSWLFDGCLDYAARWFEDEQSSRRVLEFSAGPRSLDAARLTAALDRPQFVALCRAFADGIYQRVACVNTDTRAVVDQTPSHVYSAELIRTLFPDAYFVHVIRDPRSVVCSMQAADWGGFPKTAADGARMWKSSIERGRAIHRQTDRYLEVRYEALLQDAGAQIDRVLSLAGLPSSRDEIDRAVAECAIGRLRAHPVAPSQFFRNGLADGWATELSRSDTRIVEYLTRDRMSELGYAPSQRWSRIPLRLWLRDLFVPPWREMSREAACGRPS